MIIRILNEGQYEVDDAKLDALNEIDTRLEDAVASKDDAKFRATLNELHTAVVSGGKAVADDYIGESDLVLPDINSTLDEVAQLLGDEGLIPD